MKRSEAVSSLARVIQDNLDVRSPKEMANIYLAHLESIGMLPPESDEAFSIFGDEEPVHMCDDEDKPDNYCGAV